MQTDSVEKAAGIGAIGLWAALHGWLGWLVVLYAVCMMLDWVTGTVLAIKNGVWSSHKARQGLWHKCGSIIMIFVSVLTDILLGLTLNHISGLTLPFNYDMLLTPIVPCVDFCVNRNTPGNLHQQRNSEMVLFQFQSCRCYLNVQNVSVFGIFCA